MSGGLFKSKQKTEMHLCTYRACHSQDFVGVHDEFIRGSIALKIIQHPDLESHRREQKGNHFHLMKHSKSDSSNLPYNQGIQPF